MVSVTNRIPDYLKLHIEEPPAADSARSIPELHQLSALFPVMTGLRLVIDEQSDASQLTFPWQEGGLAGYRVSLESAKAELQPSVENRREFEQTLTKLLNSFARTRAELQRREAELAAAVPVVSVEDDGQHLADRLQGVLGASVDMLQCSKAALYLLDEGTTALKLRAHVGLTNDAFLAAPRPLEDTAADIEAMAGHAVVVDCTQPTHWRVPELCESAICVPVASATTILGTLWFFRDFQREFSPTEQNLAEITAGRLAADLERAVLVQEVRSLRDRKTPDRAPTEISFPKVAPYLDGWEVGDGPTPRIRTSFSNWCLAEDGRLHLAVGRSGTHEPQSATVAMQAAHAAHAQHDPGIKQLFNLLNQSLWTWSEEGSESALFHGVLDPDSGSLEYAIAGGVFAFVLRPHGWEPLLAGPDQLGRDDRLRIEIHRQVMMPGDVLVVMNGIGTDRSYDQDRVMNRVAENLLRNTHLSATEIAERASRTLRKKFVSTDADFSVVVAKRDE